MNARKNRARRGVRLGVIAATLYSGIAVVLYVASGQITERDKAAELVTILIAYYVAAIVGGSVIGWYVHLANRALGRAFLGFTLSGIVVASVAPVILGPPWTWNQDAWLGLLLAVGIFGTIFGVLYRDFFT